MIDPFYLFFSVLIILMIVNIILSIKSGKIKEGKELPEIKIAIGMLTSQLKDTEKNLKDEFVTNRKESADLSRELRAEIGNQLNLFTKTFSDQLGILTSKK
jgi:DNA recombination protein RmuC